MKKTKTPLMMEVGRTGLVRWNGYVDDEFHKNLKGAKAARVYREMGDNHPIIGSFLFFMQMIARRVEYSFEARDGEITPEREFARKQIGEAFEDLPGKLAGVVCELISMAQFGWVGLEKVFKIRRGENPSKYLRSDYDDGAWGWRRLAPRAQESLDRWEFDEHGEVLGMWQRAAPDFTTVFIPREKLLLAQLLPHKGSPEGRCLLRPAYVPYYTQANLQLTEAIGLERSLAGLPHLQVPRAIAEATSGDLYALKMRLQKWVSNIRKDAYGGLLTMTEEDAEGKTGYKFGLVNSGGSQKTEADTAIRRYRDEIAIVLMWQFSLLGSRPNGSLALSSSQTDMLALAADGLINAALAPLNDDAIPELCKLNGIDRDDSPIVTHGDFEKQDLQALGSFIAQVSASGHIQPSHELENALLRTADMPEVETDRNDDGASLPTAAEVDAALERARSLDADAAEQGGRNV